MEHKRVKRLYNLTNKNRGFEGQIAKGVRRGELLTKWGNQAGFGPAQKHKHKKDKQMRDRLRAAGREQARRLRRLRIDSTDDVELANAPANLHYQISTDTRVHFNLQTFVAENADDPACDVCASITVCIQAAYHNAVSIL